MLVNVVGYCPMGCGRTLAVETSQVGMVELGVVHCTSPDCPDKLRVTTILRDDAPESKHLVLFLEHTFTVQHPLRERGDELFGCPIHARIAERFDGPPPGGTGTYHVTTYGAEQELVVEAYQLDQYRPDA